MAQIALTMSDEILATLGTNPERAAEELRLAAGMKLFELGRLSSGAAAEVAGVPKPLFLQKLAEYGIPTFRLTARELEEDAASVRGD